MEPSEKDGRIVRPIWEFRGADKQIGPPTPTGRRADR
jgi:hypothetical protein